MDSVEIANVAKALAHPVRLQIVELLARQCECRGAEVFAELPLAQSTISEHLRILREARIVDASPRGTSTVYCLDPSVVEAFALAVGTYAGLSRACAGQRCCG